MGWYQQILTKFKASHEDGGMCTYYSRYSQGLSDHCRQLEVLYKTAPVGLTYVDTDMRIIYINDWLAEKSRKSPTELMGLTLEEAVPNIAKSLIECCQEVIKTEKPLFNFELSTSMPLHPQVRKHYLANFYPIFSADQTVIGVSSVIQDVSVLKQAERVLWLSEQRYRALVETAGSIIICMDPDFRIIEWNSSAEKLFGRERSEVLGTNLSELFPSKENWQRVSEHLKEVLKYRNTEEIEDVVEEGGCDKVLKWSFACLEDMDRHCYGVIMIGHDITTHKHLETRLEHARRSLKSLVARVRERRTRAHLVR